MSWQINELDANKTSQCISNENARLDDCRKEYERLSIEYDHLKSVYMTKLHAIEEKKTSIRKSIAYGQQFVKDCIAHLDELNNNNIKQEIC